MSESVGMAELKVSWRQICPLLRAACPFHGAALGEEMLVGNVRHRWAEACW
jgi:hypothetical protein